MQVFNKKYCLIKKKYYICVTKLITHLKINNMKEFIKKEIKLNLNYNYYGTENSINNQNVIFDYFLDNNIINQIWFDDRLKNTEMETLNELLNLL